MSEKIVVPLAALGLCEGCEVLVDMTRLPTDAMDAAWVCNDCKKELTYESFGYEEVAGKWNRTRWIGANGKWTDIQPAEDFTLGGYYVLVKHLRHFW